jgi:hypothetical protein
MRSPPYLEDRFFYLYPHVLDFLGGDLSLCISTAMNCFDKQ